MRVFVLGTGRCGTMTFAKACSHITNYTSGHETHRLHPERFPEYPDNHIEVDAHLSWMLGAVWDRYGWDLQDVKYVWLRRDPEAVARSFLQRAGAKQLVAALFQTDEPARLPLMRQLVNVIEQNIEHFCRARGGVFLPVAIEEAAEQWDMFWDWIGAEGDKEAGRAEFKTRYNASQPAAVDVPAGMNRVTLNATWLCHNGCPECSQRYLRDRYGGYQMSMEEIETFLECTGRHRFDTITISGGEPLLWEHLEEGLARLRGSGVADRIEMFTSGLPAERLTPRVLALLDEVRLSVYDWNYDVARNFHACYSAVRPIDRREHVRIPGALLPHEDVMPAECDCTGWMISMGRAFACPMVPALLGEYGMDAERYAMLMSRVEPGYLNQLAPYIPACYDPCRGCINNRKVRRILEDQR